MRIRLILLPCLFLALLSACGSIQIPFLASPTRPLPRKTATSSGTDTPVPTDTETPTPSSTPTITPTLTPFPTRTSPYPVGLGTPLPDMGFQKVTVDNLPNLSPVFKIVGQDIWQTAASRDGTELFAATSNGLVVYDAQGKEINHWPSIMLFDSRCKSCLSVTEDGSRFAMITRQNGKWVLVIYDVNGHDALLWQTRPLDVPLFENSANGVRVALSHDGLLMAYSAGDGDTVVVGTNEDKTYLTYKGQADALVFAPAGAGFAIQRARELLFWKINVWKNPSNLLLPANDTPYAFSRDGKYIAIATSTKLRVFLVDTLAPVREIEIPPSSANNRVWQLAFADPTTLRGYGILWDASHTTATVDVGEWDVETGKTLKMETSTTATPPDILSTLWGAAIPTAAPTTEVALGQYNKFHFTDPDTLLVNSDHNACWLKLSTGEKSCFSDPKYRVLASEFGAYREVPQDHDTVLQNWNGGNLFDVRPSQILAVERSAKFILINASNATTDLYTQGKKLPVESLAGILRAYAENGNQIVMMAQPGANLFSITLVDKTSLQTLYQKKDSSILSPLAISSDGRVYFIQKDPDKPQVILRVIDPKTFAITEIGRLTLPADPRVMTRAADGTFALGLEDGSLVVVSADGKQNASYQAAYSPISGISFTSDGRYLAVASSEGIRIFAILP